MKTELGQLAAIHEYVRGIQGEIWEWLGLGHSVEDVLGVLESRVAERRGWRRRCLSEEISRLRKIAWFQGYQRKVGVRA